MRCPACQFENPRGLVVCAHCGADLAGSSAVAVIEAWRERSAVAAQALRATLGGLTAVNVQVEPLNADAEADGLRRSDLQADVETALREAGLAVLSSTELFASAAGTPVLRLDVMTLRLDGRYAYSLRLELWQAVRLAREPGIQALAITWSRPQLVGTIAADRLAEIRRVVRSAVGEFLQDLAATTAR